MIYIFQGPYVINIELDSRSPQHIALKKGKGQFKPLPQQPTGSIVGCTNEEASNYNPAATVACTAGDADWFADNPQINAGSFPNECCEYSCENPMDFVELGGVCSEEWMSTYCDEGSSWPGVGLATSFVTMCNACPCDPVNELCTDPNWINLGDGDPIGGPNYSWFKYDYCDRCGYNWSGVQTTPASGDLEVPAYLGMGAAPNMPDNLITWNVGPPMGGINPNATPDWSLDNFCPCCGEEEPGIIPIDECEGWEGEIYDGIPYQDSLEFCSNMYFYNSNFGCMQVGEAFCNAFDNCPNPNTFPTQESCCNNIQDAIGYTPTSWEEFCG